MANLTPAPAVRQFLPGAFEDAFIYMNTLVAVTTDREIVTTTWDRLVSGATTNRDDQLLAGVFILRNDYMAEEATRALLDEMLTRTALSSQLEAFDERLLELEEWDNRFEYQDLLGDSALLDLQIYNQRLFAGTTGGLVQTDLLFELDELSFSAPTKRTDARCLSINVRYGTVAASCGADGLLMSYDEFSQLSNERSRELEMASAGPSLRSSWLGYNVVNYSTAIDAHGFRSRYEAPKVGRRSNIVTSLSPDDNMLTIEAEAEDRVDLDFLFNAHSTFFSHYTSGEYELRVRGWSRGRLGLVEQAARGTMPKPLSTHRVLNGFVAETYDSVVQIGGDGVSLLYPGESIVVRTFPASQWYRNLVLVVAEDGLHIVSPIASPVRTLG